MAEASSSPMVSSLEERTHSTFFFVVWEAPATSHRGLKTLPSQFPPLSLNSSRAKPCLAQPPACLWASALFPNGVASKQGPLLRHLPLSLGAGSRARTATGTSTGALQVSVLWLHFFLFSHLFCFVLFLRFQEMGEGKRGVNPLKSHRKRFRIFFFNSENTGTGWFESTAVLSASEPPQICYLSAEEPRPQRGRNGAGCPRPQWREGPHFLALQQLVSPSAGLGASSRQSQACRGQGMWLCGLPWRQRCLNVPSSRDSGKTIPSLS